MLQKYIDRPSPNVSATLYPTAIKVGNDGELWMSKPTRTGVYRWTRLSINSSSTAKRHSKRSAKCSTKRSAKRSPTKCSTKQSTKRSPAKCSTKRSAKRSPAKQSTKRSPAKRSTNQSKRVSQKAFDKLINKYYKSLRH